MSANNFRVSLHRGLAACVVLAALALASLASAVLAPAASAAPQWTSEVLQAPTNLPPGGRGMVRILLSNTGPDPSTSFPGVTFELPPGVTLGNPPTNNFWSCSGSPVVTCTNFLSFFPIRPFTYVGAYNLGDPTSPTTPFFINATVDIAPGTPEGSAPLTVTLTGGGADPDPAIQTHELRIASEQLPFGPTPGTFAAGTFDEAGNPYTQAGGVPDSATASFVLNRRFLEPDPSNQQTFGAAIQSQGNVKDVVVDLPAGFVGNPTVGAKCSDLGQVFDSTCPTASQVGVASVAPPVNSNGIGRMYGVFNMVPPSDAPAMFAFRSPVGTVVATPVLRSDGDLGLSIHVKDITEADLIMGAAVTLWGVPADPSHDAQRCARLNFLAQACTGTTEDGANPSSVNSEIPPEASMPHASDQPRRPFLSNPTYCSGQPLLTTAHFSPWENPASYEADGDPNLADSRWASTQDDAPAITGCDALQFDPDIRVTTTSAKPDSPTGLDFTLSVPQNDDPDGLATAHVRNATVVLPEGMKVNPASANGLAACSSPEIGLTSKTPIRFTKAEPSCPLASKIGTVVADTPLLETPLTGDVFLARQNDNPFDSLLAMYMVVRGPGLLVKLAGHVQADPQTGRLTTTVMDNPQLPFNSLTVQIKGGPKAPLTTPASCGVKSVSAALSSWAGHSIAATDGFAIDCPGNAEVFDPGFAAGSGGVVAGAFSPFVTRITRDVGKELGRVDVKMPKGLLASLKNVGVCTNAQVASSTNKAGVVTQGAPSCPTASQIGTTTVGAGSGPMPFYPMIPGTDDTGRVFLTEAHTSSAFGPPGLLQVDYGLAIEVPAVAGPFDLGTVMVRAALYMDPETGQLTVVSDRLPRILQGIPLDVRDVRVDIDRPKFTVNPTSCAKHEVRATIVAQDGTTVQRATPFQVGDCARLGLSPRVSMRLIGRKQTKIGGNPALQVRLRQSGRQTNLSNVKAVLPKSLALDGENAAGDWLCSFEDGQRATCPASSRIGTAKAFSPLLKRPLSGPVYFVKNVRRDPRTGAAIRTLPTLLVKLDGEARLNVRATSASRRGYLISTFKGLPDAKVSRFDMRLRGGGSRGILAVTGERTNLCRGSHVTKLSIRGQNGRLVNQKVRMKTPCAKKKRKASGGR